MNKMPEYYIIFERKNTFPEFWAAIPGSKAASERTDPITNYEYVIMVDIVLHCVPKRKPPNFGQ